MEMVVRRGMAADGHEVAELVYYLLLYRGRQYFRPLAYRLSTGPEADTSFFGQGALTY
jgi:hypothetical protein